MSTFTKCKLLLPHPQTLPYNIMFKSSGIVLSRFNFLDKSTGLSTPFEIRNGSVVDAVSKVVETHSPLHIAVVEGLVVPGKSRGKVLRMLDENCGLVRWEVNVPCITL